LYVCVVHSLFVYRKRNSDAKFTDYENKIIFGANDKNNFEDETCHDKGTHNDVNDLHSLPCSDHDTFEMAPSSPDMAAAPTEHYVEILAPSGTLGLTIGTFVARC
jgi:hypothetical protein